MGKEINYTQIWCVIIVKWPTHFSYPPIGWIGNQPTAQNQTVHGIFFLLFWRKSTSGKLTSRAAFVTAWVDLFPFWLHSSIPVADKYLKWPTSTMLNWLDVFYVPSTARSFRDGMPIYCPLQRTWSSIFKPFPQGIEPRAVAWQSISYTIAAPRQLHSSITRSLRFIYHMNIPVMNK